VRENVAAPHVYAVPTRKKAAADESISGIICGKRRNSNARRTAYGDQRKTMNGLAIHFRDAVARTDAQQENVYIKTSSRPRARGQVS